MLLQLSMQHNSCEVRYWALFYHYYGFVSEGRSPDYCCCFAWKTLLRGIEQAILGCYAVYSLWRCSVMRDLIWICHLVFSLTCHSSNECVFQGVYCLSIGNLWQIVRSASIRRNFSWAKPTSSTLVGQLEVISEVAAIWSYGPWKAVADPCFTSSRCVLVAMLYSIASFLRASQQIFEWWPARCV